MGLSQQLYASSFATWLVIKYFCGLKGSKGVFLSPGCFLSYLWRRKQLKCVFISGCYDFWVFRTQRNPLILPLSIVCVIVVLTACDSVIPYFLAPPTSPLGSVYPPANYFHTILTVAVLLTHSFQPRKNFLPLLLFLSH